MVYQVHDTITCLTVVKITIIFYISLYAMYEFEKRFQEIKGTWTSPPLTINLSYLTNLINFSFVSFQSLPFIIIG